MSEKDHGILSHLQYLQSRLEEVIDFLVTEKILGWRHSIVLAYVEVM